MKAQLNITIKSRIIISSFILVALFLSMLMVNWFGNRAVMKKNDIASVLETETMHLQGIFRGVNEFIIDEGEPLSIELTNNHLNGFEALHNILMSSLSGTEHGEVLSEKISPQWKVVKEGAVSFMKNNPWISVEDDAAMLQYGKLTTEAKKLHKEVAALADAAQGEAKAISAKINKIVNITAAVIIFFMCFILFSLSRCITSPIRDLNIIAEGFGKGDLSKFMDESKKDEFGTLALNFNRALTKLGNFISRMKADINNVALNADRLSHDAADIASNAQEQSIQTTNAVTSSEELSATFADIAKNTEDVSTSARDAFEIAVKSGDIVTETVHGMQAIAASVSDSAQIIESLAKRSEQIGEITQVINEIAEQTNLLALNANIEAARAGEHGRGFAVVANEVRKLAERTTTATMEIASMTRGIQDDTTKAVDAMQSNNEKVESGTTLAGQAGESLQQIVGTAQNVTNLVQQIATAIDEQSSANDEIARNLAVVAEKAQDTNDNAQHASKFSTRLREITTSLQNVANEFILTRRDHEEDSGKQDAIIENTQQSLSDPETGNPRS